MPALRLSRRAERGLKPIAPEDTLSVTEQMRSSADGNPPPHLG